MLTAARPAFVTCLLPEAVRGGLGRQEVKTQAVAFVNVNVVPMDEERVLASQTVVVRDGRVSQVGPASPKAKPGRRTAEAVVLYAQMGVFTGGQ